MGGHDGGGGNGVVCYNPKGEIESVELLDFFEGRILDGYSIPDYPGNYKEIYNEALKKSASKNILAVISSGLRFEAGFKFLPKNIRLNPVNDSSEIFIPANCKIEQMANFQGTSRIFIVSDFWDRLSETGKAGLIMHEFMWYMERQAGATKSSRARRTVARFFADNYLFEPINHNVKKGDVICGATNPNHRTNNFTVGNSFFVSKIPGSESCLLSFNFLNSVLSFTKQTSILEDCSDWGFETNIATENTIPSLDETLDVVSYPEILVSHEISLYLETKYDQNNKPEKKVFRFQVQNNEFPGYDEKIVELDCHPISDEEFEDPWWL
jgi:hypothetical protein